MAWSGGLPWRRLTYDEGEVERVEEREAGNEGREDEHVAERDRDHLVEELLVARDEEGREDEATRESDDHDRDLDDGILCSQAR